MRTALTRAALLAALAIAAPAAAEPSQILDFRVAVTAEVVYAQLLLELDRLGEARVIPLADDGGHPDDVPWDGVFVGRDEGHWARYVEVRLVGVTPGGQEDLLFSGLVRTEEERRVMLGWRVKQMPAGNRALRTAAAYPDGAAGAVAGLPLVVAFGWGLFILCYVGWLVHAPPREGGA